MAVTAIVASHYVSTYANHDEPIITRTSPSLPVPNQTVSCCAARPCSPNQSPRPSPSSPLGRATSRPRWPQLAVKVKPNVTSTDGLFAALVSFPPGQACCSSTRLMSSPPRSMDLGEDLAGEVVWPTSRCLGNPGFGSKLDACQQSRG